MAISGVADADIDNGAKYLGMARKGSGTTTSIAGIMGGYSYKVPTATGADSGSKLLTLTLTNQQGPVLVDWGDGTVTTADAGSGTTTHTYATSGSKTWDLTSSGFHKRASTTLA